MKLFRVALPIALLVILAACTPAAAPQPIPGAPPVIYNGTFNDVYGEVLLAIATADGLPESNGWIIGTSDLEGGFVETSTFVGGGEGSTESLVVSLYPVGLERTGIIVQRTSEAASLGRRINQALSARFGEPVASQQPQAQAVPESEEENQ